MYILECANGTYYTGSTKNLELRLQQHQNGEGANHTKKHLPVHLVYFEEFDRIDEAFYREKQIQGWSRKKKEALIAGMPEKLHELAKCLNDTSHVGFDTSASKSNVWASATLSPQPTNDSAQAATDIEQLALSKAEASQPDIEASQPDIERSRNDRNNNKTPF